MSKLRTTNASAAVLTSWTIMVIVRSVRIAGGATVIKATEIYRVEITLPKAASVRAFNDLVWERATVDIEWSIGDKFTTIIVYPSDNMTAQELENTLFDIAKGFGVGRM